MWPTRVKPSVLVIASHGTWLLEPGTGPQALTESASGFASLSEAVESLQGAIERRVGRLAKPSVHALIEDDWLRLFGETWPGSIRTVELFRRFAEARFAQRFGAVATDWRIVTPGAWPKRSTLCMAVPKRQIEQLNELMAAAGRQLVRMVPWSIAEFESVVIDDKRDALFVSSAGPFRTALLSRSGWLCDAAVLPNSEHTVELARSVFERRNGPVSLDLRSVEIEVPRSQAITYLLDGTPLPVKGAVR